MASLLRKVQFEGINPEVEAQKTERRVQKLREKKERKMAAQSRREDIRYFLYFLETLPNRHELIRRDATTSLLVALICPNEEDNADISLQEFDRVVRNRRLPEGGTKEVCASQIVNLGQIMDRWARRGHYDRELDRFLQFLRISVGQGTLADLLVGLADDTEAAAIEARRLAAIVENNGRVGMVPASMLPEEVKRNLRVLKNTMVQREAYEFSELSIRTGSSGESSDGEVDLDI